jgi:hypothetical protein
MSKCERNVVNDSQSYTLKKKAIPSSETLVFTYKITWSYNPEDHNIHIFTAVKISDLRRVACIVGHVKSIPVACICTETKTCARK